MDFLKNHPFAVSAFFESSIVLTFAVHKEELHKFIPPNLSLDTFEDKWAFIAVAMVQTKHLRPKGFPKFMGQDFFLIGYRIFVHYINKNGKRLRGLYIIKSETDKKRMSFFGNIFTHYNYTSTDIKQHTEKNLKVIQSENSNFYLSIDQNEKAIELPKESPFSEWKDARKFAGPLPHTFTFDERKGTMLTILGLRKNWKPLPIKVRDYHFGFIDSLQLNNIVLANAFEITNVPYEWEKGKIEKW